MRTSSLLLLALGAAGCDSTGLEFRPKVTDVAAVQDLGELPVVTEQKSDIHAGDLDGQVIFGQLGAPEDPAVTGGATFTFQGTGGQVCVVLDPEAVFWTRELQVTAEELEEETAYLYDDNVQDDADLDLEGGLTAYYNGSPGLEIGDFEAIYTDGAGQDHEIKFNECQQNGYSNTPNVHAGRANVEYCTIDTDQHAGASYTIVVQTFMLPVDDSIANFGVGVFDGRCESITPTECTFRDEYNLGETSDYFTELEDAACPGRAKKVNNYCEEHLDDENPPCFEHEE